MRLASGKTKGISLATLLRSCGAVFLLLIVSATSGFSQAAIRYLPGKKLFVLDAAHVTYIFGVNERGELQHIYWGARLWRDEELTAATLPERRST